MYVAVLLVGHIVHKRFAPSTVFIPNTIHPLNICALRSCRSTFLLASKRKYISYVQYVHTGVCIRPAYCLINEKPINTYFS